MLGTASFNTVKIVVGGHLAQTSDSNSEYRARAAECNERAQQTLDQRTKDDWVKLAQSWQVLADRTETKIL
jgi:hypothetical protein